MLGKCTTNDEHYEKAEIIRSRLFIWCSHHFCLHDGTTSSYKRSPKFVYMTAPYWSTCHHSFFRDITMFVYITSPRLLSWNYHACLHDVKLFLHDFTIFAYTTSNCFFTWRHHICFKTACLHDVTNILLQPLVYMTSPWYQPIASPRPDYEAVSHPITVRVASEVVGGGGWW